MSQTAKESEEQGETTPQQIPHPALFLPAESEGFWERHRQRIQQKALENKISVPLEKELLSAFQSICKPGEDCASRVESALLEWLAVQKVPVAPVEVARQLYLGRLTCERALEALFGLDDLLRWFACDCVERVLLREGRDPALPVMRCPVEHSCNPKMLAVARRYAAGLASAQELKEVGDETLLAAENAISAAEKRKEDWQILDRPVSWLVGGKDALRAAISSARQGSSAAWRQGGRAVHWKYKLASDASKTASAVEENWQSRRLIHLCEVWTLCGERSAWLLLENQCPIEESPSVALDFQLPLCRAQQATPDSETKVPQKQGTLIGSLKDLEQTFARSFQEGFQEGCQQVQKEVATKMLRGGYQAELIQRITGLSMEELHALQEPVVRESGE